MTPDQIITAELLAGLTKCPVCGEGIYHRESNGNIIFQCGSLYAVGRTVKYGQTSSCPLRARVKELEEALKPLAKVPIEDYIITVSDVLKARNLLEKGSK